MQPVWLYLDTFRLGLPTETQVVYTQAMLAEAKFQRGNSGIRLPSQR